MNKSQPGQGERNKRWLMHSGSHLTGGSGGGARHHRRVGHLHRQVLVVHQRPGALHLTRLEVVREGAQVRVPEEAAVRVVGLPTSARRRRRQAPLVVAHVGLGGVVAVVVGGQQWRAMLRGQLRLEGGQRTLGRVPRPR